MTATYEKIATNTISNSTTNSVTFSSISGSYTDLVLVINGGATSGNDLGIRFNSDTGSNYSRTTVTGNGSAASSSRASSQTYIRITVNAYPETSLYTFNSIVSINNYSNSTTYKTLLARSNNANTGVDAVVGLWRNTNAITSIIIFNDGGAAYYFLNGSTLNLYGIKAE